MKLIVLAAVVSIAVFRASCRERPQGRNLNDVDRNLSDSTNLPEYSDFSDGDDLDYITDLPAGPKDEAATVEPDAFSRGPVDRVSTTEIDMAFPTIEFGPDLVQGGFQNNNSSDIDYQWRKVDRNLSDSTNLPEYSDFSDGDDLDYITDLPAGQKDEATTFEPDAFSSGPVDRVSTTDIDMAFPTIEFGPDLVQGGFQNYNSSDIDYQWRKDGTVQRERKLRGGSNCKPDTMCSLLGGSCMSNSTYCAGREFPSLCGGAKCKCCIKVNLEVKMQDVETELQSMVVNLTIANAHLNTKLESMMNFIISANSSQSNLNSNMDLKIDSIMSTNSNLTLANAHINTKLESMSNFIITANSNQSIVNSNLKKDLQFIKSNVTNAFANQDSKLDSMMKKRGCPEGFFLFSNKCFRILRDKKRNWDTAKAACKALGLDLSQPVDPVQLSNYLQKKYGNLYWIWVNLRGDGSSLKWQRTNHVISKTSTLWWPGQPGNNVATGHCVTLMSYDGWQKSHPTKIYYTHACSNAGIWTLCELVNE